jgi:hypothetical protein
VWWWWRNILPRCGDDGARGGLRSASTRSPPLNSLSYPFSLFLPTGGRGGGRVVVVVVVAVAAVVVVLLMVARDGMWC